MDAFKTDPTPRLLVLARAAVIAVEERRKTDDALRSTRPLADAALEERARVLAEVLGQADRRAADAVDAPKPRDRSTAARTLGDPSGADGIDCGDPTVVAPSALNLEGERRGGRECFRSFASSSNIYRDDMRLTDGEDRPCELVRTEPSQATLRIVF